MIWNSPFTFEAVAEKCIYTYVMETLEKKSADTPDTKVLISAENASHYLTYKALIYQVKAVEAYLHKSGFGKGQVGTVVMPSYIEVIPFYLAVVGRGGIYSGMSPLLTEFEIQRQLSDSCTNVIFTSGALLEKVVAATEKLAKKVTIICLNSTEAYDNVTRWEDVLKTEGEAPKHENDIHEVAVMPYSSGTTGMPKGVMLTHYNLMSAVLNKIKHTDDYVPRPPCPDKGSEPVWDRPQLLCMPSYHISGKLLVIAHLVAGSKVVMMSHFDIRVFLRSIEHYKVWNVTISPPILLQLVKDPLVEKYNLSSLGYVKSLAAPLGPKLAGEFAKKYPDVMLTQLYAMSECMHPFLVNCDRKDNFATGGYVAPGYQARIVHLESGRPLKANQEGEIVIKGPSVMKGYLNKPEATREAIDEEGWMHTGDIGYISDKGELFVVDRKKEMIKVNGVQVAPAEIESVLVADPRIEDVGVVAVPHSKHGEVPGAFIVRSDPDLDEDNVMEIVREHVADFKWPDGVIVFVDRIPKLPSGKILRRHLRDLVNRVN